MFSTIEKSLKCWSVYKFWLIVCLTMLIHMARNLLTNLFYIHEKWPYCMSTMNLKCLVNIYVTLRFVGLLFEIDINGCLQPASYISLFVK